MRVFVPRDIIEAHWDRRDILDECPVSQVTRFIVGLSGNLVSKGVRWYLHKGNNEYLRLLGGQSVNSLCLTFRRFPVFDELSTLLDVPDVSAAINAGLGIDPDSLGQVSEVTLLNMLVDDSYSITGGGNLDNLMNGFNGILDALMGSKAAGTILVHARTLNGRVICPYVALKDAPKLNKQNFSADGCTPLYDETVVFGGTIATKTKELLDAGIIVKSVSLILTDGKDEGSRRNSIGDAKKVVEGLLNSETAVFGGMGFGLSGTDFKAIFKGMGIRDDSILLATSDPKEIRARCHQFSQSAIRVSQTAGALGGLTV